MSTSRWLRIAALGLVLTGTIVLPAPGERARAQSSALYVNAVDLDIVPAERDKYLAAIKENGAAAIREPGCRQFDILVLASDPNHIFLYEVYENEAAFQAHRQTEHFKKYAALTANMVSKRNARQMTPVALHSKEH